MIEQLVQGYILGDYEITHHIADGSFGPLYGATHRFTRKKVLIKVIPTQVTRHGLFQNVFQQEAETVASLSHENLVALQGVSYAEGLYFFVTEAVCDGSGTVMTLRDVYMGKKVTVAEACYVIEQLASVLDYIHTVKTVSGEMLSHGSIRPESIYIRSIGPKGPQIAVAETGFYKILGHNRLLVHSCLASLAVDDPNHWEWLDSSGGVGRGTTSLVELYAQRMPFMPPEMRALNQEPTVAADIWASGVLFLWMITGGAFPEGAWEELDTVRQLGAEYILAIRSCVDQVAERRPRLLLPVWASVREKATQQSITTLPQQQQVLLAQMQQKQTPQFHQQNVSQSMQEKVVTEYFPERRDTKSIVPLLTDGIIIQGGVYTRGSNQGCRDETPRHGVRLRTFAIDIHPVTNEQFVRFLDILGNEKDTGNHDIIRLKDSRIKRSAGRFTIERGYAKHPVVGVTWYGATAYAAWIGRRLPTEAEWEVACCGGLESPTYPVGEDIEKSQANFFSADTTPVMSYPPNGYGIYDMVGNVYEWCSDWYEYNYYDYSSQEPDFPQGPIQGVYRVLRGGCWRSLKEDLRCSKRHRNNPGAANATYGFRTSYDVI